MVLVSKAMCTMSWAATTLTVSLTPALTHKAPARLPCASPAMSASCVKRCATAARPASKLTGHLTGICVMLCMFCLPPDQALWTDFAHSAIRGLWGLAAGSTRSELIDFRCQHLSFMENPVSQGRPWDAVQASPRSLNMTSRNSR